MAPAVCVPIVHAAATQVVSPAGNALHALVTAPSHCGVQTPVPVQTRGAVGLPRTGEQVPSLPPTLHASHTPAHEVSQQRPSTQNPVPHEVPAVHTAPVGSEHVPFPFALHLRPLAHEPVEQHTPSTQNLLVH